MQRVILVLSGVLLTLGLLLPARSMWVVASTLWIAHPSGSGTLYRYHDFLVPTAFGSLAVIAIGLIVTWAGYVKGVRWTWFVLFVIVWLWGFPVLMPPYAHPWRAVAVIPPALWRALTEGGEFWTFAEIAVTFPLLVLGLVLPIPIFIRGPGGGAATGRQPEGTPIAGCGSLSARNAPPNGGPGQRLMSEQEGPSAISKAESLRAARGHARRWHLRPRRDLLVLSAILFTAALLMLAPAMWKAATTMHHQGKLWGAGPETRFQYGFAPAGFTSLAVIAVGLIVTWAAYIKGVRWTWFVLLVIVWVWAFPVFIIPYLRPWKDVPTVAQSFASFITEGGPIRNFVEVLVAFALMLPALVLPVKTFVLGRGVGPGTPGRTNRGAPDERSLPEI